MWRLLAWQDNGGRILLHAGRMPLPPAIHAIHACYTRKHQRETRKTKTKNKIWATQVYPIPWHTPQPTAMGHVKVRSISLLSPEVDWIYTANYSYSSLSQYPWHRSLRSRRNANGDALCCCPKCSRTLRNLVPHLKTYHSLASSDCLKCCSRMFLRSKSCCFLHTRRSSARRFLSNDRAQTASSRSNSFGVFAWLL